MNVLKEMFRQLHGCFKTNVLLTSTWMFKNKCFVNEHMNALKQMFC